MEIIAQCKGERITMTPWERSKGATIDNMLFLTENMAELHEEATLKTGTIPNADGGLIFNKDTLKWIAMTVALGRVTSDEVFDDLAESKASNNTKKTLATATNNNEIMSKMIFGTSALALGIVIGMYLILLEFTVFFNTICVHVFCFCLRFARHP